MIHSLHEDESGSFYLSKNERYFMCLILLFNSCSSRMKNRIKELFLQIYALPMEEQRDILEKNMLDWMSQSDEKQIDDRLAIGIRV